MTIQRIQQKLKDDTSLLNFLSDFLIIIILISHFFSILLWWVHSGYFSKNFLASISSFPEDGWCDPGTQGLGVHCFGDYYYALLMSQTENPWNMEVGINPYPALGMLPIKLFGEIGEYFQNPRIGLYLFLLTIFISLIAPVIWATSKFSAVNRILIILLFGPTSFSGLITLDRGNSVGLLPPLILWLYFSLLNKNKNQVIFSLLFLTFIKPHFGILIVILLAIRWFKQFFLVLVSSFIFHFLAFLLWPRDFPKNILMFINSILNFQTYGDLDKNQISIAKGFAFLENLFNTDAEYANLFAVIHQNQIGFLFLTLIIMFTLINIKDLPIFHIYSYLIIAITLASGTVWEYYTVIFIPLTCIIFYSLTIDRERVKSILINTNSKNLSFTLNIFYIFSLSLAFIRIPLFQSNSQNVDVIQTSAVLIPIFWTFYITLVNLIILFKRSKIRSYAENSFKSVLN